MLFLVNARFENKLFHSLFLDSRLNQKFKGDKNNTR